MVRRWDRFRDPWDREYAMRGRLWRGGADVSVVQGTFSRDARVLELGCGDGKFLHSLSEAGFDAIGLDRSRHALRLACQGGAAAVEADARRLPMRDGAFGSVAARYVLGSMLQADRVQAAAEVWRAVTPGGAVFVEEFSVDDFRAGQGSLREEGTVERNRGILTHYWTRGELERIFPHVPVRVEERRWTQRTRGGPAQRSALRGWWTRPR